MPALIILTGFVFGLFLFWKETLRATFFYKKVNKLADATHVLVKGVPGNVTIVKLFETKKSESFVENKHQTNLKNTFEYRFIRFRFEF